MVTITSIVGALSALTAYFMVSTERWKPTSMNYNAVNLLSCVVLGGVAIYTGTAGYILLNSVWGVLAVKNLAARQEGNT